MENFKGCLKSPIDVRDYKIASISTVDLPEEYEVEVLPRVKNQKAVNSCVAHSTSSILEYFEQISGRFQKLSTNFIYGIQKSECGHEGQGMYLRDACKIVCKYGDMLEHECPGNNEIPECWEKAEEALKNTSYQINASSFKIKSYFSCTNNNAIKNAIMNYGPVLASIKWYDSYKPDKNGILSTIKKGDSGYHAIMIYGWDKTGFKCQNSWGTHWGKDGRFISPYEIKIAEARCFVDEVDTKVIIPKRNAVFDFFYNLANFFINLFKN
jgi:C1A family cysteine protease